MWLEECINDLFDSGMRNDKLNLLYLMNRNAKVAVKTPFGSTDRVIIRKVVMQGTVWGSLLCTATMDKLGKLKYFETISGEVGAHHHGGTGSQD